VRLQPLGHLSGVNRMEGTASKEAATQLHLLSIRGALFFSILWVKSPNRNLKA
jgi:hypothetical protein